ncbi:OTU-like cysteine protease [Tribonema minus]|uniref:Ubiquitin thioesterase OTU n=1 Tax=Tribonema minus TaxID=303371 RepID=A0A835ZCY8_9STRA|nr:OTU-like cysteine protease [Tribonema minus]
MPINLRVTWSKAEDGTRQSGKLLGLDDSTTLLQLKLAVEGISSIPADRQTILSGFPPKEVAGGTDAAITALGITNGSAVSVAQSTTATPDAPAAATPPPSAAAPTPAALAAAAPAAAPAAAAVAPAHPGAATKDLIDMGFSPAVAAKALQLAGGDAAAAIELCLSGGLDDRDIASDIASGTGSANATGNNSATLEHRPTFVRRVVDADNSCLFTSVGYCVTRERGEKGGGRMRRVITQAVRAAPDTFSEAILGMQPEAYCGWIMNPEKWGGEIELVVLSDHYKLEICVVDIATGRTYLYGEDKGYSQRIFLLYDGVHYDAMAEAFSPNAPEDLDTTRFDITDDAKVEAAKSVAAELKRQKQYVDLAGCDLKCLVCGKGLQGQKGARDHAVATRHQNFGQI